VPIAAWSPEGGPGQYELNLGPLDALEAADQGFLFKQAVKEVCALQGLLGTFMPKLDPMGYGSSLHVHQSLWDAEGAPTGRAEGEPHGISAQFRAYVAGMLATLRDFAVLFLPTLNSYKRLQPESAAGTTRSWGYDNKTMSLRVLTHEPRATRVEHRVPGADANVYLALAAMIAGGVHGVEQNLELPAPNTGNAYADAELELLPGTLDEAIEAFEGSAVARAQLGDEFVDYYAATRRWELEQFRAHVTDWELRRYLARS
jgi:glutamine synthetase